VAKKLLSDDEIFGSGAGQPDLLTDEDVFGAPTDPNLKEFVKQQEGYRAQPYGDFKQTSVGYGTRYRAYKCSDCG
jgi:hypothetical protein